MTGFLTLVLILLLLKTVAELVLDVLNRREVQAHAKEIPEAYRDTMDDETYQKSVDYTLVKNGFGMLETVYDAIWLVIILLSGVLPWLFYALTDVLGMSVWGQALVLFAIGIALSLPSIPMELWSTFKIEARFGFNKTTPKLWITDKIKGLVLSLILGYPLLCLLLWFFQALPQTWWLWGFFAFFGFQLLMLLLYPRLILPLFNKLEPLPEGNLRDQLLALGERTGFTASTIHVMDGSKRSSHSNAFFTGFGKFRRIVLFDTLIEQLEARELEAVLAHEIGHYKRGHIPKMLVMSAVSSLIGFGAIGWLAGQPWFFEAFGFTVNDGMVPALLLFAIVSGLFTFWLGPLLNGLSRKHEYEADAFARKAMGNDPQPLITSLHKMYEKNLSNLTPHPAYSAFHYSHPTLAEREASLKA
ncbi:M48 family metallopeptidase [Rubellicoccus peritrichatus]|uniref:M48 family metallopeptidase n=1 Tax=Rubellicoccus peritrichatus TaxID=3080537 RepID=A0AAQ3QVM7_9BACT|nr:M48 family metallopeptidase [Puniceicoccus sp. CR14]WOO41070.1 M48 family metallopeptidase [Puniceicoccus sp. CR14]